MDQITVDIGKRKNQDECGECPFPHSKNYYRRMVCPIYGKNLTTENPRTSIYLRCEECLGSQVKPTGE